MTSSNDRTSIKQILKTNLPHFTVGANWAVASRQRSVACGVAASFKSDGWHIDVFCFPTTKTWDHLPMFLVDALNSQGISFGEVASVLKVSQDIIEKYQAITCIDIEKQYIDIVERCSSRIISSVLMGCVLEGENLRRQNLVEVYKQRFSAEKFHEAEDTQDHHIITLGDFDEVSRRAAYRCDKLRGAIHAGVVEALPWAARSR